MRTLAILATSFCALAVILGPLERLFPARVKQRVFRPEWGVDLCFFLGQYLAFGALVTSFLSALVRWTGEHSVLALREWGAHQPVWLLAAVSLVLGDLAMYWFHRACHHYEVLWRFHSVHHSAEHLDWLAAYREHPLDGLGTQLVLNLPGILLGLPFEAMGAVVVFRGIWAVFIHSNIRLPLGPLHYLFGAPELHHWHHARVGRTAHNFANLAPWLDILFGTYHCPKGPETYPLGLSRPWPKGYLSQLVEPFLGSRRVSRPRARPR